MSGSQFPSNPAGAETVDSPPSFPPPSAPAPGVSRAVWPQPVPGLTDPRRKSPPLACILSLMPGLGQVYVGYYTRGFVHAIVVASLITVLNLKSSVEMEPLFAMFLAFFWLYNVIDAGRRAALYNFSLVGMAQIELPEDFTASGIGGSILGGAVLVVIGAIVMSHTLFGASLDWVAEWWPVAPIALGLYLIGKAIADRRAKR